MQREHQMDSILNIPVTGERMLKEIKPLYPQIQGCTYAETFSFTFEKDTLKQLPKVPSLFLRLRAIRCVSAINEKLKSGCRIDWIMKAWMFFLMRRRNNFSFLKSEQHSDSYFMEVVFMKRSENGRIEKPVSDAVSQFGVRNELRSI